MDTGMSRKSGSDQGVKKLKNKKGTCDYVREWLTLGSKGLPLGPFGSLVV